MYYSAVHLSYISYDPEPNVITVIIYYIIILLLIRIYFLFDIRYLEIEWDMEFFTEPHKNTSHWDPSRQQGRLVNSCYANCRYVAHIIHLNVKR